jgi:hypothetical protein
MMTIVAYIVSDRLICTAAANVKRRQAEACPTSGGHS